MVSGCHSVKFSMSNLRCPSLLLYPSPSIALPPKLLAQVLSASHSKALPKLFPISAPCLAFYGLVEKMNIHPPPRLCFYGLVFLPCSHQLRCPQLSYFTRAFSCSNRLKGNPRTLRVVIGGLTPPPGFPSH